MAVLHGKARAPQTGSHNGFILQRRRDSRLAPMLESAQQVDGMTLQHGDAGVSENGEKVSKPLDRESHIDLHD